MKADFFSTLNANDIKTIAKSKATNNFAVKNFESNTNYVKAKKFIKHFKELDPTLATKYRPYLVKASEVIEDDLKLLRFAIASAKKRSDSYDSFIGYIDILYYLIIMLCMRTMTTKKRPMITYKSVMMGLKMLGQQGREYAFKAVTGKEYTSENEEEVLRKAERDSKDESEESAVGSFDVETASNKSAVKSGADKLKMLKAEQARVIAMSQGGRKVGKDVRKAIGLKGSLENRYQKITLSDSNRVIVEDISRTVDDAIENIFTGISKVKDVSIIEVNNAVSGSLKGKGIFFRYGYKVSIKGIADAVKLGFEYCITDSEYQDIQEYDDPSLELDNLYIDGEVVGSNLGTVATRKAILKAIKEKKNGVSIPVNKVAVPVSTPVSKAVASTPVEPVNTPVASKKSPKIKELFELDVDGFNATGASSGSEIRWDADKAKKYVHTILDGLKQRSIGKGQIKDSLCDMLENENHHLLNLVLSVGGYFDNPIREHEYDKYENDSYFSNVIKAVKEYGSPNKDVGQTNGDVGNLDYLSIDAVGRSVAETESSLGVTFSDYKSMKYTSTVLSELVSRNIKKGSLSDDVFEQIKADKQLLVLRVALAVGGYFKNYEKQTEIRKEFEYNKSMQDFIKVVERMTKFPTIKVQGCEEQVCSDKKISTMTEKVSVTDYVSSDETRYFMMGVYCENGYQIATDGRRMIKLKADYAPENEKKIVKVNKGEMVDGEFMKDATFPNYERVIPDDSGKNIENVTQYFSDMNKLIKRCVLMIKFSKLKGCGRFYNYFVEVEDMCFNPYYLRDALLMAKKKNWLNVVREVEGYSSTVKFFNKNGDGSCVVIMPMHIDFQKDAKVVGIRDDGSFYCFDYNLDDSLKVKREELRKKMLELGGEIR